MVEVGKLVTTDLSSAGGWVLNSKMLHWMPIKKDYPYLLISVKKANWSYTPVGTILTQNGVLVEVILSIFNQV